MAAIGKIREQSTLLLIVIGGAMVAFVFLDFFTGSGGVQPDRYVGEVAGEEINMIDYERKVEAYKQSMATVGQPVTSEAEQQIRNQVWNEMIQETIMHGELSKLGMRISRDEFDDIRFGENVRPEFFQGENFQNPETGQFDPQLVQNYFAFLQQQYPVFYENQVTRIVNERLYEKYNNMVKRGIHVNTLDAKNEYYKQEQKVRFNFVVREFSSVADSLVDVSDSELKAYYSKNKDSERFQRDATADLKFVSFKVEPTEDDEAEIVEDLRDLVEEFRSARNDSIFALKYGDSRRGTPVRFETGDDEELKAFSDTAEIGDIVGPFKRGDRYIISKVKEVEDEEQASARHILLSNQSGTPSEVLKSRADSIVKVIRSKKNFEEMVDLFTEDPGSKATGGKYEGFNREAMVSEFSDASFDRPIGSLNVVETDFGVHIVEPLARNTARVLNVIEVDNRVRPSNRTFNEVYDEANDFSLSAENVKGMEALASERGYTVKDANKVRRGAVNVPGISRSVDAVRWAHNTEKTKKGQLSEPFEFDNQIVVLGLVERRSEGLAPFEDVKDEIKPDVVREKKVAMFTDELKGKSLAEASEEFELTSKLAANVSEKRPNLTGMGAEPYVVGFALSLAEGAVSNPIEGKKGVYLIEVLSKTSVEPRAEYVAYRDELEEKRKGEMVDYDTGVYKALKDIANVKDERSKVY
ncbi:MAG: peptidylprolyl isomerase [Cryomorphaceae bacterium]